MKEIGIPCAAGRVFYKDGREYVVAHCVQTENGVSALLLSSAQKQYVAAERFRADGNGSYAWDCGYCAADYYDAAANYVRRIRN